MVNGEAMQPVSCFFAFWQVTASREITRQYKKTYTYVHDTSLTTEARKRLESLTHSKACPTPIIIINPKSSRVLLVYINPFNLQIYMVIGSNQNNRILKF